MKIRQHSTAYTLITELLNRASRNDQLEVARDRFTPVFQGMLLTYLVQEPGNDAARHFSIEHATPSSTQHTLPL
jgi:hypothetical protein